MIDGIAPELEVLLCCARRHLDAAQTARLRALCASPLDWGRLLEAADRHGLDPLVHRHLGALCPDRLPGPLATRLQERVTVTGVRNRYLAVELRKTLALFDDHGIQAIAYKGPALALDENGWVTRLEAGAFAETLLCNVRGGHYPAGNYTVFYDGEGKLEFAGAATVAARIMERGWFPRAVPSGRRSAGRHARPGQAARRDSHTDRT